MSKDRENLMVTIAGIAVVSIMAILAKNTLNKKSRKQPYGTIWKDEDFGRPGSVFYVGGSRCTWS